MKFLKIFVATVAMTLVTACTSCQKDVQLVDAGVPVVDAVQLTVHAEPLVLVDELPSFDAGVDSQDDVILLDSVATVPSAAPASSTAAPSVNSPESLPVK